jgi:hypothetical protein
MLYLQVQESRTKLIWDGHFGVGYLCCEYIRILSSILLMWLALDVCFVNTNTSIK